MAQRTQPGQGDGAPREMPRRGISGTKSWTSLCDVSGPREGGLPRQLVQTLEAQFQDAGLPAPRAEAESLVAGILGVGRTELYLREDPVSSRALAALSGLLERRLAGQPLQYLLGSTEFCGHELHVAPGVFIPRPETEVLVVEAVESLRRMVGRGRPSVFVLDVGAGSGNLSISLACAIEACVIVAAELSWDALTVLRRNAEALGVAGRVLPVQADWACGLKGPYDLIVSNPPYVPTGEIDGLAREIGHEPRMSLDGGPDGMAFHRRLIEAAPPLLRDGGALCVECAETQAEPLLRLIRTQPWVARARVVEDLTGRPRGLWVERRHEGTSV